ncbi:hypothetical protein LP420_13245 [Massilia sp. B-10]|nr:hypothetical protein LP420_13245 [Massilia sp. B-10]
MNWVAIRCWPRVPRPSCRALGMQVALRSLFRAAGPAPPGQETIGA